MLIKQPALEQQLRNKLAALYVLVGQDIYLMEQSAVSITSHIKKQHNCDEKRLTIQSTEDWASVQEEACSYSLFADTTLLHLVYEKKTLESGAKKLLNAYLDAVNPRCFIILKAPNLPNAQVTWLTDQREAVVVSSYPLNTEAMIRWIGDKLRQVPFRLAPGVPELIQHYTQGNMLACAQTIERLQLCFSPESSLSIEAVLEHLSNQCEHSLYELVSACHLGQADKAVQILRQAANNKTEVVLALWVLTQELRLLIQLAPALQKTSFTTACTQLKIAPYRSPLYQASLKRLQEPVIYQLLSYCRRIDERIKSNTSAQAWSNLECLAASIALGSLVGDASAPPILGRL